MVMKSAEGMHESEWDEKVDRPVEQPTRIDLSVNLARKDD
jgi:hypothetical protein